MTRPLVIFISILVVVVVYGICDFTSHRPEVFENEADASASYAEKLQTDSWRETVAEVYLKQVARDPDSVVVESTSGLEHRTLHGKEVLVFSVQYRARNGFGGYNRDVSWMVSDLDGTNARILDRKP